MADDTVEAYPTGMLRVEPWIHTAHAALLSLFQIEDPEYARVVDFLYQIDRVVGTRLAFLLVTDGQEGRESAIRGICVLEQAIYEEDSKRVFEVMYWFLHRVCDDWSDDQSHAAQRMLMEAGIRAAGDYRSSPAAAVECYPTDSQETVLDELDFHPYGPGLWRHELSE